MAEHYYSEQPLCDEKVKELNVNVFGNDLKLKTASGVFSIGRLDKGTEALLNYCKIENSEKILDLGSGYGIVGIAIAKAYPGAEVWMSDVNKRAIRLARENIKINKVSNATAKAGDMLEKLPCDFDAILLNPPQVAGRNVCESMIENSYEHLKVKGTLQIVARKNKGGETLSKKMENIFGNVDVLGKKSGFWVYRSRK